MKAKIILYLTLFLLGRSSDLKAQESASARSAGLSGISVTLDDLHSIVENPAQNTSLNSAVAGIDVSSVFMIAGLKSSKASFLLPIKKSHAFSIHYARSGTENFYRQNIQVTYGIKLSPKLSMGIGIERLSILYTAEKELNLSSWSSSLGFSSTPIKGLTFAASISNPEKSNWNNLEKTKLPSILRFGNLISLSDKSKLYTQINKESNQEASVRTGLEYFPLKQIQFRAGLNINPVSPSFGISISWKQTKIDFSLSDNSNLGFSPQISIQQKFK